MVCLLFVCSACTHSQAVRQLNSQSGDLPKRALVADVPFFPQEDYFCGPASLATVFNYYGIAVTQEAVSKAVYTPGLRGSLQIEMLAATRNRGLLAYELSPSLDSLLAEIAADHPVIVLQNLGLDWLPSWHYAVVIGYDLDNNRIILHSGTRRAYSMPLRTFEYTWARSGRWALVALPPEALPHDNNPQRVLKAANDLEKSGQLTAAKSTYRAAVSRWPNNLVAHMGLGNTNFALGDLGAASAAYRTATQVDPGSAAAFNNLAVSLLELNCVGSAHDAIDCALRLDDNRSSEIQDTLEQIKNAPNRKQAPTGCPLIECRGAEKQR